MDRSEKRGRNPADDLTDDLVVEILSRLPVKSVCRFKCVSKHWRHRLIAHPDHRTKLQQTLSGFFRHDVYRDTKGDGTMSSPYLVSSDDDDNGGDLGGYQSDHDKTWTTFPDLVSISGKEARSIVSDPALSFLPGYRCVVPKSCSNGLLLCLCWKVAPKRESDYVVCNPATQQWVTVPGYGHRERSAMRMHLGVAASGHFHVFTMLREELEGNVAGVDIYSSEAGSWRHCASGWASDAMVYSRRVFHRGMLHLVTLCPAVVTVDTEGTTWRTIPLVEAMYSVHLTTSNGPFIGVSQGRLHYVNNRGRRQNTLSVWILGDDDGQWILRCSISTIPIFGANIRDLEEYCLVGIHPECNTIFFAFRRRRKYLLLSYDLDREEVRALGDLEFGGCWFKPYLPYVPSFSRIAGSSMIEEDKILLVLLE